jgi:5,10-methylene-tetrahydrofolate dehydrogenase/methenyl tetrahydrofolate cyclohydrolase
MEKIDGVGIAQKIIERLKNQNRPDKILAAVLVGDNPESRNFLKQKEKIAKKLGVGFKIYKFPENSTNDFLRKEIGKIALLKKAGGMIVQLPLPSRLNKHYLLNIIPQEKDVDVLGEGAHLVLPPAVGVVEEIIKNLKLKIKNYRVAVVGAGFLVGKPIAVFLRGKVKELAIFEKGSDLSGLKNFDLVISGVGQAGLIKPEMLKDGAGVIDFGCLIKNGKIRGDFDLSGLKTKNLKLKTNWYTPTPGGTGPILVAKLFENFYNLAGV